MTSPLWASVSPLQVVGGLARENVHDWPGLLKVLYKCFILFHFPSTLSNLEVARWRQREAKGVWRAQSHPMTGRKHLDGTPCLLLGSLCHRDTRLPTVPAGFASCYPTGFMRNNPLVYTASVSRVFMRAVTSETGQGRAGRQLSSWQNK